MGSEVHGPGAQAPGSLQVTAPAARAWAIAAATAAVSVPAPDAEADAWIVRGWADVAVFDPATVAPGPIRRVRDFPADAERLTADQPVGMRHILVNGTPVQVDGERTGATGAGQLVKPGKRG